MTRTDKGQLACFRSFKQIFLENGFLYQVKPLSINLFLDFKLVNGCFVFDY